MTCRSPSWRGSPGARSSPCIFRTSWRTAGCGSTTPSGTEWCRAPTRSGCWPWPAFRCAANPAIEREPDTMARLDPHSHTELEQPHQKHLSWKAEVDFAGRTLQGTATLRFDRGGSPVDLDSRGLAIESVTTVDGRPLRYEMGPSEPILGERLRIELPPGVDTCVIRYRTGANASALQWLEPEQTAGGKSPFLYSQCQAIHARSVVPLQDTPRLRITYEAELIVPVALRGLDRKSG